MSDFYHPKLNYNKKFYSLWFMRRIVGYSNRLLDWIDARQDRKICGCSLVKYVPSLYRESKGATGSQSTRYWALEKMFAGETFSPTDRFMDIGCGKARVLAYLLRENFPGTLSGIELNHEVAEYAKAWTRAYENVTILEGDAFQQNFDDYNVFFLGRPFETVFFKLFVKKFEEELTHPVRVIYWVDQQSGNYLNNRPGWTMHKRAWLFRIRGLYTAPNPQRYSIWTYTPKS